MNEAIITKTTITAAFKWFRVKQFSHPYTLITQVHHQTNNYYIISLKNYMFFFQILYLFFYVNHAQYIINFDNT